MRGRPLIALWSDRRNVPFPGELSFRVSHRTRRAPLSLVNDPVCVFPWPDHDPIERQTTTSCGAGLGWDRQAPPARTVAAIRTVTYRRTIGTFKSGNRIMGNRVM